MKFAFFVPSALAAVTLLTTVLPADAQTQVVHLRAWIDGRSELSLSGAQAQWQHFDFAAPGRLNCDTGSPLEPTHIDASLWFPVWPDVPTCENRFCDGCFSDVFTGITPPLPATEFFAYIVPVMNRGDLSIIEQPTALNGYRTVINFNDNGFGGADWYECDLYVETCFSDSYCTSTPNSSGRPAYMLAGGSLSVSGGQLLLNARDCAAMRPGIFFFGINGANIPMANGRLCIDPFSGLQRLPMAWTDEFGVAVKFVDYSSMPFLPDSTWYFQYWFRDPAGGGTGSNLTDGVRVRFCP